MKRKTWLIIAALLISAAGFSQHEQTTKDDLLFLLRQPEHISQALKTIKQLDDGAATSLAPGKIVIIVCGEAVKSLTSPIADPWTKALKDHPNLSILACGLSLSKFEMAKGDLASGIGYTENGFIKAFELQKEGYLSVEL